VTEVAIDYGSTQVREEGMPEKRHLRGKGVRGSSDRGVPDVQPLSRPGANEASLEVASVKPRKKDRGDAAAEVKAFDIHIEFPWDTIPFVDGEQLLGNLMAAMEKGRITLRDRMAAAAKSNLHCSNAECLRPLRDERQAMAIWTVRDKKTGIERTFYSCSEKCHRLIHKFQAQDRVIRT
jgi:hypothetical protein